MATLSRSLASLRVFGDDLEPFEVSALLESAPTQSHRKGETLTSKRGTTRTASTGFWSLKADETAPADLDSQIAGLLSQLSSNEDVWRALRTRYEIDLFCGWFMEVYNEGIGLRADTLTALGTRGIALSIDLYSNADE